VVQGQEVERQPRQRRERRPGVNVIDFLNIVAGKNAKMTILRQKAAFYIRIKWISTLVFKKNANFWLKIGENRRK
jgi:hypothetical protein